MLEKEMMLRDTVWQQLKSVLVLNSECSFEDVAGMELEIRGVIDSGLLTSYTHGVEAMKDSMVPIINQTVNQSYDRGYSDAIKASKK